MNVKELILESLHSMPELHDVIEHDHAEYGEVIIIPARHSEVGDMLIEVEPDDIRVHIGHITHCHLNGTCDSVMDASSKQNSMIQETIEFLKDVLNDKIVFWKGWWMDGSFSADELATLKRKNEFAIICGQDRFEGKVFVHGMVEACVAD